ncbi:MAG: TAXI family TRAP transporter solute-binding subunit [Acidobacteria bacterium]|nr:TAXI family TRAP transporter solute-binding subunit [Acidobacteriota bacterium]MYJ04601.1 TAXI family TRAP transporter solute-binding subunit [Acidobacteriota bacterium]
MSRSTIVFRRLVSVRRSFPFARIHLSARILGALLALLVPLAACGGGGGDGDAGDSSAPSRQFLSLGSAPAGGAFFVVGSALAEVVNETGASLGYNVTAEATSGSQENIRRLASGELDFALSNAAITYFAVRGSEGWDRAYSARSVMTLAPNVALFVTQADSGISTIDDLRDRRVTVGPAGAGFEYFVGPLLEAHGVTYDDFSPLNATQQAAVDMLTDGSADATFLGGAVPTASITQAAASMEITFIPFGDDEKQRLVDDYLFFRPATIPPETYRGQTEAFDGLDVGSMHLITSAEASDDLVYNVTRLLYENRELVVEKHAAGRAINPANVVRDTGTEFHPGAIRFYQEAGIWPQ